MMDIVDIFFYYCWHEWMLVTHSDDYQKKSKTKKIKTAKTIITIFSQWLKCPRYVGYKFCTNCSLTH